MKGRFGGTFHRTRAAGAAALLALSVSGCAGGPAAVSQTGPLVWPPPPEPPRFHFEQTITGSGDIIEETTADRLKRVATGESTRGKGFDKPFGVVAVNGRVYVGDTVSRRIAVYDLATKRYLEIGASGSGALQKPLGIAADQKGRIYVVDATAKRVTVYDQTGTYVGAIANGNMLERPSGVGVNADGSRVYVVDTGGVTSDSHRVRVFSGDGKHLFDFGRRGSAPGEFNLPNYLTVGPDGNVYVVDNGNFRIEKFSADGEFISSFGGVGRQSGQFSRPKGVAVDKDANVYVVDAAFGNFQIFDKEGRLLLYVGERDEKGGPGKFLLPSGISVDNDGRVYVVDQFLRKLEVFRPAGIPAERPAQKTARR
jgi:DNA-binding beta-propeller fold protein YncE